MKVFTSRPKEIEHYDFIQILDDNRIRFYNVATGLISHRRVFRYLFEDGYLCDTIDNINENVLKKYHCKLQIVSSNSCYEYVEIIRVYN